MVNGMAGKGGGVKEIRKMEDGGWEVGTERGV